MIYIAMAKNTQFLSESGFTVLQEGEDITSLLSKNKPAENSGNDDIINTRSALNKLEILEAYTNLYQAQNFCREIDRVILLNFEDIVITQRDVQKYYKGDDFCKTSIWHLWDLKLKTKQFS